MFHYQVTYVSTVEFKRLTFSRWRPCPRFYAPVQKCQEAYCKSGLLINQQFIETAICGGVAMGSMARTPYEEAYEPESAGSRGERAGNFEAIPTSSTATMQS